VTLQDLGSIGELIAGIATIATIAYLAVQVRRNTRALRSSTFQGISEQMAQNVESIVMSGEVAALFVKGLNGLDDLSTGERIRFQSVLVMSIRRMEAVHVHAQLGSIDRDMIQGFNRSMFSLLQTPGGLEWWTTAKATFNSQFVADVDTWLAENKPSKVHPSMGVSLLVEADR